MKKTKDIFIELMITFAIGAILFSIMIPIIESIRDTNRQEFLEKLADEIRQSRTTPLEVTPEVKLKLDCGTKPL